MTMTAMPTHETAGNQADKPSRRKLVIIVVVLLVAALGAGYQFVFMGGAEEPLAGEVVPLEAIQINLAGGHYLRLGLALQAAEGAEEVEGSKALDAAIELFSGQKVGDVTDPQERRKLKDRLSAQVRLLYDDEVLEVYFTDFVTQ